MISRNKLFYTLFAFMMVMASCSDVDELLYSDGNAEDSGAITFGADDSNTRAVGSLDADGIKANSFGVYAYYTGTTSWGAHEVMKSANFMDNVKVSYNNGNWYYSPIKYWPKNSQEKISYFAYSPYTSNSSYLSTSSGAPTIAYEIVDHNNDLKTERMWDLVVAKNVDVSGKPTNDSERTIKFSFKHVTSRLAINAKLSNKLTKAGSKVYISNVYAYGIYRSAKYNLATSQWVNHAIADSVDFTKRIDSVDCQVNNKKLHGVELTNTTAKNIFRDMPYMFMIPQNGLGRLKFEYYIVTGDTYELKTGELTILKNFEEGHAYALNVTFGSNGITGGEDNDGDDNNGSDNSGLGFDYIQSNGGAYYLHHGWIWDYKEDYMFQKTSDGKYTLTLGGNPGVFYVLKKQGVYEYTDIYGLDYYNYSYTFDFNKTYTIMHSSNVTSWSVQNMTIKEASGNNVYKFTFDPDVPSLKVEQIDPGDNTFVVPPTTQTNAELPNQYTSNNGVTAKILRDQTWSIFYTINGNSVYGMGSGLVFKNLGNGLHVLEMDRLYPFQLYTKDWVYSLANGYDYYGSNSIKMDVPHRAVIRLNGGGGANISFADGKYIENATIIIDFNSETGPMIIVNGTPRN